MTPLPTPAQLATPAGVAEYREAATVSVVRFRKASQPPCFWIKLSRVFNAGAYPQDVCEPTGRSQRYELELVEALKGDSAKKAPALFVGRNPIDTSWLFERRPEIWWSRPSTMAVEDDPFAVINGPPRGHSVFAFRHRGRIGDHTVVIEPGVCSNEEIPYIAAYNGDANYLIFQNGNGRIRHWEIAGAGQSPSDVIVDRLRRLKAGEADVRERISAKTFFASLRIVSLYEVKWCGSHARLRPAGGQRNGRLDEVVRWHWTGEDSKSCKAGQQFLVIGAGPLDKRWSDERAWPSVQLVPITNGEIRRDDIVSQLKIEGPNTIPVSQALAWTD